MGGNNEFFENFERNKYLKNIPSMQRVKGHGLTEGDNSISDSKLAVCASA